ncbi:MAG: hypothetical protein V1859_03685 [archaeon]
MTRPLSVGADVIAKQKASLEGMLETKEVARSHIFENIGEYTLKDGTHARAIVMSPDMMLENGYFPQILDLNRSIFTSEWNVGQYKRQRATLTVMIVDDSDQVLGTANIEWKPQIVTNTNNPLNDLGVVYFSGDAVYKDMQGKHVGTALLDARFKALNVGLLTKLIDNSDAATLLGEYNRAVKRTIGDEPVTIENIREAIRPENLLIISEFEDPSSHLGRFMNAGEANGYEISDRAKLVVGPWGLYSSFRAEPGERGLYFTIGDNRKFALPLDSTGIRKMELTSRLTSTAEIYIFGPDDAVLLGIEDHSMKTFQQTEGATWREGPGLYAGTDIAAFQTHLDSMRGYLVSKGFSIVEYPITADPLVNRDLFLQERNAMRENFDRHLQQLQSQPPSEYVAVFSPSPAVVRLAVTPK